MQLLRAVASDAPHVNNVDVFVVFGPLTLPCVQCPLCFCNELGPEELNSLSAQNQCMSVFVEVASGRFIFCV